MGASEVWAGKAGSLSGSGTFMSTGGPQPGASDTTVLASAEARQGYRQPRLARPFSLLTAAVAGGGATYGILHGINSGALASFFTGAAVKSVMSLSSFVGAAGFLTLVTGYCYHRCSARLNRLEKNLVADDPQRDKFLGTNKMLSALSFLASSAGLGLSVGALVTTLTGGTDFGMSLIIGGAVGFVAGLLGLALIGTHNKVSASREANQ